MIDLSELKSRAIRIPSKNSEVPTDKEGFVDFSPARNSLKSLKRFSFSSSSSQKSSQSEPSSLASSQNFFSFMDSPQDSSGNFSPQPVSPSLSSSTSFSAREFLRKISAQISELDNKIYKLEQRIELLERKTGV